MKSTGMNMFNQATATLTVLLVEDSLVQRDATRLYLENVQDPTLSVLEAANATEGLEILAACHVDCVLLDFELPDMNGLEFMDAMYTLSLPFRPPVVVVTGHGSENVAVQALKNGADDYIVKSEHAEHLELLPFVIHKVYREKMLSYEKQQMDTLLWWSVASKDVLLDVMSEGVLGVDSNGDILFMNPVACRLLLAQGIQSQQGHVTHVLKSLARDEKNQPSIDQLCHLLTAGENGDVTLTVQPERLGGSADETGYQVKLSLHPLVGQLKEKGGAVIMVQRLPV